MGSNTLLSLCRQKYLLRWENNANPSLPERRCSGDTPASWSLSRFSHVCLFNTLNVSPLAFNVDFDQVLLSAGFCLKVTMALCCTQGISGLQKEKQPEWSFCIQGPGELFVGYRKNRRSYGMDNLARYSLFFALFYSGLNIIAILQLQAPFDVFFIIKRWD